MNDDLGPEDRTLGTALSRAVAAQNVRETPFERSRLGERMARPRRTSFLLPALATAAAIVLGVAVGATLLGQRNVQPGPVAGQPVGSPAATFDPGAPSPSSTPRGPTEVLRVFFARDQLPVVGAQVQIEVNEGPSFEGYTRASLRALAVTAPPAGATNLARGLKATVDTVRIEGDVARVDYKVPAEGWGIAGSAATQGLLQQLVYTATEQRGVRAVLLTQNGGASATIDGLVVNGPLTREDVAGYSVAADPSVDTQDEERTATATTTVSNELVAPGLGRLAIELRPTTPVPGGFWSPPATAQLRPNDDADAPGKSILTVTLQGVTDARAGSTMQVDGSPIRQVRVRQTPAGVSYDLFLDDARPWRLGLERGSGTMRVLVDTGGHPTAITTNTAVYVPRVAATVGRSFTASGLARAFEATVSWRIRDSAGREVARGFTNASIGTSAYWGTYEFTAEVPASVSGNVTLDVFQASPRDGADVNKVEIPLTVR